MAGKQHVFIVGSKGIPASYGGFETFVAKLTQYKKSPRIQYHVAVLSDHTGEYMHNGARCFCVKVPTSAARRPCTMTARRWTPASPTAKNIRRSGDRYFTSSPAGSDRLSLTTGSRSMRWAGKLFVNPDGHEWKRQNGTPLSGGYWKHSEKGMVRNADLLVCDSKNIEKYIRKEYAKYKPKDDLYRLRFREQPFCAGR